MTVADLYNTLNSLETWPSFVIDSRKIELDSVFFALEGSKVDGHDFVEQAIHLGVSYVIGQKECIDHPKYIQVDSSLEYMQQLAQYRRQKLKAKIIGLTGSNGKTTTKELLQVVLERKFRTESTVGNLNNHIGVPLTLLNFSPNIEVGIVEMGANHVGEIEYLCELAQPDLGTITNIGKAHIGEFGSFEHIKRGKGELLYYLKNHLRPFLYLDHDTHIVDMVGHYFNAHPIGGSQHGTFQYSSGSDSPASIVFQGYELVSRLEGRYNQENIAIASAFGIYLEVAPLDIQAAIESYVPSNQRSEIITTSSQNMLIADCYNSNPSSLALALNNLANRAEEHKLAIISDMNEMGEFALKEHKEILYQIVDLGLECILIGSEFSRALQEINPGKYCQWFNSTEEVKVHLSSNHDISNTTILLKGSRTFGLEVLIEHL